jgi:hypothetical protein
MRLSKDDYPYKTLEHTPPRVNEDYRKTPLPYDSAVEKIHALLLPKYTRHAIAYL